MLFLRRDAHNYLLFKDCNIFKFHDRTALENSILIHKSFKPKHKLLQRNQKEDNIIEKPRTISKKFSTIEQNLTRKKYNNKKVHNDIKIDMNIGNRRWTDKNMTSKFQCYLASIHNQKIPTKYLINQRQKKASKETTGNTKCRLCPEMSVSYYLPIRHDVVADITVSMALTWKLIQLINSGISKILNTSVKLKTVNFVGIFPFKWQQS